MNLVTPPPLDTPIEYLSYLRGATPPLSRSCPRLPHPTSKCMISSHLPSHQSGLFIPITRGTSAKTLTSYSFGLLEPSRRLRFGVSVTFVIERVSSRPRPRPRPGQAPYFEPA
jgi:hypothetical protein